MLAIGATRHLPVDHPDFLVAFDAPIPEVRANDILVRVRAIAVNPVDTKIRKSLGDGPHHPPRILGWDATGIVEDVGSTAFGLFRPGDEVYYAGDLTRSGCNAEYQCVDYLGDPLKAKCAHIVWEFMAARAKFKSPDLARQGEFLEAIAAMHDAGILPAIHTRTLDGLTIENLRQAHEIMEKSTAHGKIIITL